MNYFISTAPLENIKIVPSNEIEEIIQNLHVLLSTAIGSVPMYRNFGIDTDIVDRNINTAKSLVVNAIYDSIEKFEPRAEIVNITFKGDAMEGKLAPVVEVKISEQ